MTMFTEKDPILDEVMDLLTYRCAVYNVEQHGMTWESIALLFNDLDNKMERRYALENGGEIPDKAQVCREIGGC